jgi:dynein light intermediate chain 1
MQPTPLPPLNNPMLEQTFLMKNYKENTRGAGDRDLRCIFCMPTDTSAAPASGLSTPLGSSLAILASDS